MRRKRRERVWLRLPCMKTPKLYYYHWFAHAVFFLQSETVSFSSGYICSITTCRIHHFPITCNQSISFFIGWILTIRRQLTNLSLLTLRHQLMWQCFIT